MFEGVKQLVAYPPLSVKVQLGAVVQAVAKPAPAVAVRADLSKGALPAIRRRSRTCRRGCKARSQLPLSLKALDGGRPLILDIYCDLLD